MAEAICGVVIDHADGLHEGVADGGADEAEAAFFQVFAHGVGYWRECRKAREFFPIILQWLAVYEVPDVHVEGAEFFLDLQEGLGVADGGFDFQAVADDAGIFEQHIVYCGDRSGLLFLDRSWRMRVGSFGVF